jgi:predicted phage tail protein
MKIYLYGKLKQLHQDPLQVNVNRWDQAYSALCSLIPEFRTTFTGLDEVAIIKKSGDKSTPITDKNKDFPLNCDELHIIPKIEGSGIEAALIAYGMSASMAAAVAFVATNIVLPMVLSYAVVALSPKPKLGSSDEKEKKESYYFRKQENVTDPGTPIPLIFGRFTVGSIIASIGLRTKDIYVPPVPEEVQSPIDPLPVLDSEYVFIDSGGGM